MRHSEYDIVEVVGRYVDLTPKGQEHVGLCPFHADRRPSLQVNKKKGIYKCFACGAGGTAVAFVMAIEKCSAKMAMDHLEGRYPRVQRGPAQKKYRTYYDEPTPDMSATHADMVRELTPARLTRLATALRITEASLRRLGVGFSPDNLAYSFPMRDGAGKITGIRFRAMDGKKWAVVGSKEGVFVPEDLPATGPLLIAEGPTDTAALLDMEYAAIGRPSCMGGIEPTRAYAARREAVIVADADGPGLEGAEVLAKRLGSVARNVRLIAPPWEKDIRAWAAAGGTRAALDCIIRNHRTHAGAVAS